MWAAFFARRLWGSLSAALLSRRRLCCSFGNVPAVNGDSPSHTYDGRLRRDGGRQDKTQNDI